ncbi:hypothetical protein LOAG_07935 [Loa loa]|uniref:Uncharacterized protein n=2 Tax=Loa loa TaxID=7209 RepID=A0A1S0TV89_LOALO|nr:hypothetical protein LOAG_07935 [Loa loa]EFO20557.1 hypothetical protein LOAG_07935 [Loa loa]
MAEKLKCCNPDVCKQLLEENVPDKKKQTLERQVHVEVPSQITTFANIYFNRNAGRVKGFAEKCLQSPWSLTMHSRHFPQSRALPIARF